MPSHLSVEQILSQSSISQDANQYGYSEDEKLLLDEAEQSYNRILDAITNQCINGMTKDTESSSQILQVPCMQDVLPSVGRDNHEILDTRDLSQINFVYNDITFQIYSDPKASNQRSGRTDIQTREAELDTSSQDQE
jgi:hypothetical protein